MIATIAMIALGSSVVGVIITKIFDIILYKIQRKDKQTDSKSDEERLIERALMNLMLDRIRYVGRDYIRKGTVNFDDRRILNEMHSSYKALGGNGDLDLLMEAVDELPLEV